MARMLAAEVRSAKRSRWQSSMRGEARRYALPIAARAVAVFVEGADVVVLGLERGDDEARIGALVAASRHPLGLGDRAPSPAPTGSRGPAEVGKAAGGLSGLERFLLGPGKRDMDVRDRPAVAGQAKEVVNSISPARVIRSSRAKPGSACRMILTLGQH